MYAAIYDYVLDYLNKTDPLSEVQIKSIYQYVTPTQMTNLLTTVTKNKIA